MPIKGRRFMKKLFSLRPSDKWTARIFLTAIAIYCAWTGYIIISKHAEIPINPLLLIMLVPVFLVDGIKISLDTLIPVKYINGREDSSKVILIVTSNNGDKLVRRDLAD